MRKFALGSLSVVSAIGLCTGVALAAPPPPQIHVTPFIMGGTGRPNPADFPGYMENVRSYYIVPNTLCGTTGAAYVCDPSVSVFTPETAWPVYGGLQALTWKDSINQGVVDLDTTFRDTYATADPETDRFVIFGYSQSGAIVAIEKRALADDPTIDENLIEWVIIGNSSRPNGGINTRVPFTIPIVNFPYGPPTPTDTQMDTTDIAFKWDIIADAPTYFWNPVALGNALLGFWYVHGTMPDPTAASPDSTPGGYSQEQWQDMMDHPENYPDIIKIDHYGDTTYLTVTPTVLPLVQPLHSIPVVGVPVADLMEPALRVFIEETGYDRSINPGVPTPMKLIPIINPITLTVDLAQAGVQGVEKFVSDLGGLTGSPTTPLQTTSEQPLATSVEPALAPMTNTLSTLTEPPATNGSVLTTEPATKPHKPSVKLGNLFRPGSVTPDSGATGEGTQSRPNAFRPLATLRDTLSHALGQADDPAPASDGAVSDGTASDG